MSDHTILIFATLLPLILAVIAHWIRATNGASAIGWYAGSLLSFGLAFFVWQRTGSRLTQTLAILVMTLWLVFGGLAIYRIA